MKEFDYDKEIKTAFGYNGLILLAKIVDKIRFKVKFVGLENIPKDQGYILAVNHISGFDAITIAACGKIDNLFFMAKSEFFENWFMNWLFNWMNTFPIKRDSADKTSLNFAIRLLQEGNVLVIFPEGTRSKDLTGPQRGKSGVSLIAKRAQSDVLPVSIYNNEEIKFRSKVTVRFGELIKYEELGFTEDGKSSELKNATRIIMDRINQLWEEGHWK